MTPAEDIEKFKVQAKSSTTHSAGIVAMDILSNVQVVEGSDAKNWLLLGGKDGKITVRSYNPETGESDHQVATLAKAHSKQVNVVSWASTYSHPQGGINEPGMFVSGGADKTVKIWDCEHKAAGDKFTFKEKHVIKGVHTGEITGLSVHASGKYVAACGAGSLWSLSDLATGQVLAKSDSDAIAGGGYSTTHFHPDGLILGLGGADSSIRIWDVKSLSCVSTFTGHSGGRKINSIAFSENGYYLASTAHGESVVKLWDLRKLVNFHTIELGNAAAVSKVSWDESGMYLGVGYGSDVR